MLISVHVRNVVHEVVAVSVEHAGINFITVIFAYKRKLKNNSRLRHFIAYAVVINVSKIDCSLRLELIAEKVNALYLEGYTSHRVYVFLIPFVYVPVVSGMTDY